MDFRCCRVIKSDKEACDKEDARHDGNRGVLLLFSPQLTDLSGFHICGKKKIVHMLDQVKTQ